MSRTIVGTVLAFALAIAPVFYCTQSWAELPVKAIAEAASKAVEKMKVKTWWENHHEEVEDEARKKAGELLLKLPSDCAKEALERGTCKDPSE